MPVPVIWGVGALVSAAAGKYLVDKHAEKKFKDQSSKFYSLRRKIKKNAKSARKFAKKGLGENQSLCLAYIREATELLESSGIKYLPGKDGDLPKRFNKPLVRLQRTHDDNLYMNKSLLVSKGTDFGTAARAVNSTGSAPQLAVALYVMGTVVDIKRKFSAIEENQVALNKLRKAHKRQKKQVSTLKKTIQAERKMITLDGENLLEQIRIELDGTQYDNHILQTLLNTLHKVMGC